LGKGIDVAGKAREFRWADALVDGGKVRFLLGDGSFWVPLEELTGPELRSLVGFIRRGDTPGGLVNYSTSWSGGMIRNAVRVLHGVDPLASDEVAKDDGGDEEEEGEAIPPVPPVPTGGGDAAGAALWALIAPTAQSVLAGTVASAVEAGFKNLKVPTPIVVKMPNGEARKVEGLTHKSFPLLVKRAGAKVIQQYPYLVGPAGTGKSHACRQLADALGVPFRGDITLTAETGAHELFGWTVPGTGEVKVTGFETAVREGGVFLVDEMDRGNSFLLSSFASGLAAGAFNFESGPATMHPDTYIVGAGNTDLTGGTDQYVSAQSQDASTGDRFILVPWDPDTEMEVAISRGIDPVHGPAWAAKVAGWRVAARKLSIPVTLSVRTIQRATFLAAMGERDAVIERDAVWRGVAADNVKRIKAEAGSV
jgi:AAA domain (dynein-related subfamily)